MSVRRIAILTGLSPAAVSLALRESPKISAATRRRVRRIADQIGYRPNTKVAELMSAMRLGTGAGRGGCFGVVSLYPHPHPWKDSLHLTRIHRSMERRAEQLGYRLEPLWIKGPGMSPKRMRSILAARGIEGLLCFGSDRVDDDFPRELNACATVTVGLSIRTGLHRVTPHFYNDVVHTLERVHQLGYRRPGLILGAYEDVRSARAYSAGYLGWCEHHLGREQALPILRLERAEAEPIQTWLRLHRPDAVIVAHRYDALREFQAAWSKMPSRSTRAVGVAAISQLLEGTGLAGMQQNQELMGAWSVELLTARLQHRDLGIPLHPRIEMVEGHWIDGPSLPPRRR